MLPELRCRAWVPVLTMALGGLAACSREAPAPSGAISGAMPPVAAAGSLLSVTATSTSKQTYTALADPRTGAFSFASLPPGTYQLTFSTTTASEFPRSVSATVVAGTTATPAIPPITHDGVGRGTLKWTLNGQTYAATNFIRVYGEGTYFNVWGRAGAFGTASLVRDVVLTLPQDFRDPSRQAHPFSGAGTYPLGGPGPVDPTGGCAVFVNDEPYLFARYVSVGGSAVGTLHLTRYDAEQGTAAGTFDFKASWQTGALGIPNTPDQVAVTGGEFDITF